MAIDFKSFDELFAPEYQLTYISTDGHIDVGPNTYSVFHNYTMQERQIIFQVCEKHLSWEYTEMQEQWERTMYMYQFIIKSPPPFPYEEYSLNEDIIMAITWDVEGIIIDTAYKEISVSATRTDSESLDPPIVIVLDRVSVQTNINKSRALDMVYSKAQTELQRRITDATFQEDIDALEVQAKNNLEARDN